MKRALCVALLLGGMAAAQQSNMNQPLAQQMSNVTVRTAVGPTYSDQYCAGFVTNKAPDAGKYLVAGMETPAQSHYAQGDTIFLEGSGYTEGARYTIVRQLKDPNKSEPFPGQKAALAGAGMPYAELGRVRIVAVRGENAVAEVEFSCQDMVPGDYAIPFVERTPLLFKPKAHFERFPAASGSVKARILMAKDFDTLVGQGQKVYLNVGEDKGVKVGDYFRVVRSYDPASMDYVDALSNRIPSMEDTQNNMIMPSAERLSKLPIRAIGEMIVLEVTPTSATAMITYSLENMNVGDYVELEGPGGAPNPQ